jgi:hypothetical protein
MGRRSVAIGAVAGTRCADEGGHADGHPCRQEASQMASSEEGDGYRHGRQRDKGPEARDPRVETRDRTHAG